ncbi:AfsR/SARP family transcriptional regulator [Kitasatospora sp. GP82]|uniref:AfsR/SARP family transcriptional regulator n=1 Tax=Kitasatospora sp. GP82 TaxID=3035089 RepID=UPI002472EB8B|nr:AfsR/SARP family transcriptional regulator [Kitasatospora sp. GP82]MDH6124817.1 DNA-binding SARP family transcriptional activator [Kitasatospora sp. GP82]
MEFGILGPLQIRDDAELRVVPAAKQRVLLAALLIRRGQVVPAGQLADTVWDTRPPRSASTTLRNYVMRLRKGLGPAGERIETRAGGYLINVDPDEFDAHRFTVLQELGGEALRHGVPARAAALFDEALGLWRGPALVDVDSDALHRAEAERLAEARLDVLESKLEAELQLGHHAALFGELRLLTAAHPERERFWVQLMTALYRSGRQSEALAVYRQVRRFLGEEIGVEPGTELRAIHQRILCADPDLDELAPRQGAAERGTLHLATVTPFQLPPDLPDFTGRAAETADLTARLTAGGRRVPLVAVVSGGPGSGKSALAVHVAHAVRAGHPDGILYADLRGTHREPTAPCTVLHGFLLALGVPACAIPGGTAERTALYRSMLAGRRLLVVLDDARDAAQVRPLLPADPANTALVTGRGRLTDLAGAHLVQPAAMSDREARIFLARASGQTRTTGDPHAAAALVRVCGGLPLALRICAARLAARPSWTARELADRLTADGRLLDELRAGDLDVRAAFDGTHDALDPAAARAFRLLALGGAPSLRVEAAARILGEPVPLTERLLERLVAAHLLSTPEAGEYRYDDLLLVYAREQSLRLDSELDRRRAQEQAAQRTGPLVAMAC